MVLRVDFDNYSYGLLQKEFFTHFPNAPYNKVKIVDMSKLAWNISGSYFVCYYTVKVIDTGGNQNMPTALSTRYRAVPKQGQDSTDRTFAFTQLNPADRNSTYLWVKDSAYTTIEEFKESLHNILLIYQAQ